VSSLADAIRKHRQTESHHKRLMRAIFGLFSGPLCFVEITAYDMRRVLPHRDATLQCSRKNVAAALRELRETHMLTYVVYDLPKESGYVSRDEQRYWRLSTRK